MERLECDKVVDGKDMFDGVVYQGFFVAFPGVYATRNE
jgi:hypothetical protein